MIRYAVKHVRRLSISTLLAAACLPATAQTPPNTPADCAAIDDAVKRLACFDAIFKGQAPAPAANTEDIQPPSNTAPVAQGPVSVTATPQDEVEKFGKRVTNIDKLEMIDVLITEAYRDVYGKWVFVTTNSQIWHQTDLKRASIPSLPAKATIKRGAFGSFRLVFEENNRAFVVKRRN